MAVKIQGTTIIDDSRNVTNLNDLSVSGDVNFTSNESLRIPSGTTAERPATPTVGELRFNTDESSFERYNGTSWNKIQNPIAGTLDKTFTTNEEIDINLNQDVGVAPVVSVIKETPQLDVTNNSWDVRPNGSNYQIEDFAYSTTLTPSNATGDGTFSLGTGSFASEDVGKRVVGNGGEAILLETNGSYELVATFNDTSTIASGDWSLFALDFGQEGLSTPVYDAIVDNYRVDLATFLYDATADAPINGGTENNYLKPDGTKYYDTNASDGTITEYDLSIPWDLRTATIANTFNADSYGTARSLFLKYDGTKMYYGVSGSIITEFNLSTPWDISTASQNSSLNLSGGPSKIDDMYISPNGDKLYVTDSSRLREYNLNTPWSINTANLQGSFIYENEYSMNGPELCFLKPDGTAAYVGQKNRGPIFQFDMTTPFDISTMSYNGIKVDTPRGIGKGLFIKPDGTLLYSGSEVYNIAKFARPTDDYFIAVTNESGQVDTSNWTDLKSFSLISEQTSSVSGRISYALSNDDKNTFFVLRSDFGPRNIVRDNSGTWQYNSDIDSNTFSLIGALNDDKELDVGIESGNPKGVEFKPDGTTLIVASGGNEGLYQYSLSTPWDISTASYDNIYEDTNSITGNRLQAFKMKPDGTKAYLVETDNGRVLEFSLNTAWDLSSINSSFDSSYSFGSDYYGGIAFKDDGSKMYLFNGTLDTIEQYSLSTPWDISNVTSDNKTLQPGSPLGSENISLQDLYFFDSGSKMYLLDAASDDAIFQYSLSSPWDISTATYDNIYFDNIPDSFPNSIYVNESLKKFYIIAGSTDKLFQFSLGDGYTTNETWVNATENNFFDAMKEALGETPVNWMDSIALSSIDNSTIPSVTDNLDLAVSLYPTSTAPGLYTDGVSINYDGNTIDTLAIPGTDYTYDLLDSSTLRFKALSNENFSIRVT